MAAATGQTEHLIRSLQFFSIKSVGYAYVDKQICILNNSLWTGDGTYGNVDQTKTGPLFDQATSKAHSYSDLRVDTTREGI